MPATSEQIRLLNQARVRCPGTTDGQLMLELFSTLEEFFKGSHVWQEDRTFAVTAGDTTYTITPTKGVINRLMWVLNADEVFVDATMQTPGNLILAAEPSAAATYTATVALSVLDPLDANSYPDCPAWIMKRYSVELLDGLLGRMMSIPKKPWTSERHAIYHMRRFRNAIAKAKVESRHMNIFAGQTWQFPQAFR